MMRISRTATATTIRAILAAVGAGVCAPAALAQSNACSNAQPIGPGTYTGTTIGATPDGSASCGASSSGADVWYRFDATEVRALVITTCSSASFDTFLSIHSGCPGTTANQVACNDDACSFNRSTTQVTVEPGRSYYIRVGGWNSAAGSYTLNVTLEDPPPPPSAGPDVIVGDLLDVAYYGAAGGISAYAVGTTSCNVGSAPVNWVSGTNQHPVIAQNMYRLNGGRFEQIGQSWLKHAFAAVNGSLCGTCVPPSGSQLGVNCSDPYGSGLNGSQSSLGPRSHVNASTGFYPYPFTNPGAGYIVPPAAAATIGRRVQVPTADIDPALNAGALYFVDGQYISADDAMANNGRNNASYRRCTIASVTANPVLASATVRREPAIRAWQAQDPSVTLVPVDYADGGVLARFWIGGRATDNGDGTWAYEYAIQNINSHRSAGSLRIPVPAGATVTNIGFHAPLSHSGEPFSNAAWTSTREGNTLTFATESFAANPNANAIRWGTLYNVRFTADVAPGTGAGVLGLFRPGDPAGVTVAGLPVPGNPCLADWDLSGAVAPADVAAFIVTWFDSLAAGNTAADIDGSGAVEPIDVAAFIRMWSGAVSTGC